MSKQQAWQQLQQTATSNGSTAEVSILHLPRPNNTHRTKLFVFVVLCTVEEGCNATRRLRVMGCLTKLYYADTSSVKPKSKGELECYKCCEPRHTRFHEARCALYAMDRPDDGKVPVRRRNHESTEVDAIIKASAINMKPRWHIRRI